MSSFPIAEAQVSVDEDTLREVVAEPGPLARWCAAHPFDPRTIDGLRLLGRLDEAAIAARRALDAPGVPALLRAVRRLQYARVLHWQGAFPSAAEQFDLAAEETGLEDPTSPSSLSVLATVFQHRATCRFDQARAERAEGRPEQAQRLWDSALEDARRALFMRERLGVAEPELLAESRRTVARLERRDLAA
ncbi:hypothetical protein [Brachybacterium sp. UNK5269]|uniref:hypothetical protein n=1 Tax=Brachybacterium sp. UNK5269 TaxID=3408576 RepID=UPI003BAFD955